jgi:hypothetical protein
MNIGTLAGMTISIVSRSLDEYNVVVFVANLRICEAEEDHHCCEGIIGSIAMATYCSTAHGVGS